MYALLLALIVGIAAPAHNDRTIASTAGAFRTPTKVKPAKIIKRGAALTGAPTATLAEIMKNPSAYADKKVTVEGKIQAVCTRKGCWMELTEKKGAKGVRVTFKDYGFFVPTNSKGMIARAEGMVVINTMTREDVDHYVSEGAQIDRNPDGTATEVRFVADGVELSKK